MLRQAVARALAGSGGFRVVAQGIDAPPPAPAPAQASGGAVLWPMENTAAAVWQLLAALDQGTVPLLLPPGLPAAKLAALRARFPGFGLLTPAGIDWPAERARLAPELYFGLLTSGSTGEPKAIVPSSKADAATGYRIMVPLHYIHAAYVRSHYNSMEIGIQDAPRPNEILFALVMGTGGRVHARLGGLTKDKVSVHDGQR